MAADQELARRDPPPTFMTLPQELRDMIIEYVLCATPTLIEYGSDHTIPVPSHAAAGLLTTSKALHQQVLTAHSRRGQGCDFTLFIGEYSQSIPNRYLIQVPLRSHLVHKGPHGSKAIDRLDIVMDRSYIKVLNEHYDDPEAYWFNAVQTVKFLCELIREGLSICKPGAWCGHLIRGACFEHIFVPVVRANIHDVRESFLDMDRVISAILRGDVGGRDGGDGTGESSLVGKLEFWDEDVMMKDFDVSRLKLL